jgi:uncharacterized UPF0146 family protein
MASRLLWLGVGAVIGSRVARRLSNDGVARAAVDVKNAVKEARATAREVETNLRRRWRV